MKTKKLISIIVIFIFVLIVGFVSWILYGYYQFFSWADEIWTEKNRIMLKEYYSPESEKKIGLYYYDSGALGYTAIQMSLVDADSTYPIGGNILQINRIPPEIKWISNDSIFTILDTSNTPGFKINEIIYIDSLKLTFKIK